MSGSAFSALTVSSIGFLYFEAVIVSPLGAVSTTGFVPLAWAGKRSERRSVAVWLPVPGSVTLSLTLVPALRATSASATKTASHVPRTTNFRCPQNLARWNNRRVNVASLLDGALPPDPMRPGRRRATAPGQHSSRAGDG